MGTDPTNIVSSLNRSLEVDRSPNAAQRASDVSQAELAEESFAMLNSKKAEAATELSKEKIRREHEKRRREMERRALISPEDDSGEDGAGLDVVV